LAGGTFNFAAANGSASNGETLNINAGNAAGGSFGGGALSFGAGSGSGSSANSFGGNINFSGGAAAGSNVGAPGGDITFTSGASNMVGRAGRIILSPAAGNGGANGYIALNQGVYNNATGFKHARLLFTGVTSTTYVQETITWTNAFADTNYTTTCSVVDSVTGPSAQGLILERLYTYSAAAVSAVIYNPTGGTLGGTLDCIAVHD
jgi:hypothetical protein